MKQTNFPMRSNGPPFCWRQRPAAIFAGCSTLLTPAITIVMGGAIGGIVVSVMDALLSINNLAVQ